MRHRTRSPILTKQDVIDFINSQPDERPVDMYNNIAAPDTGGCLLVQLHKHYFPDNKDIIGASYTYVCLHKLEEKRKESEEALNIDFEVSLLPLISRGAKSYKELKQQALTW